MPLPDPQPGLVIGYAYLWRRESDQGQEETIKDRPCAIVLARVQDQGDTVVMVAPITHSPPTAPETAVELPAATKQRLGFDDQRSWVVVSEVNRFIWPGPDLRPISRSEPSRFDYGFLPPRLFKTITAAMAALHQARRLKIVSRL
jgi:hypothetical protein